MKLPPDFIKKIARSLEEEEEDIYTLMLYTIDSDDMNYFGEADRARVKAIFKELMADTQRHAQLLRLIIEMGHG